MSRLKLTCSLLNSWLYATGPEADEGAFERFLAALEGRRQPGSRAMQAGIDFEAAINAYVRDEPLSVAAGVDNGEAVKAVARFGNRLRGARLQVREEKPVTLAGRDLLLVGVADALKAGILYDIKRVQRYEYGKYQFSAQHPMYMALFPETIRFDYLIFDGTYCHRETYRRGDYEPIETGVQTFLRYLDDAGLMDIYQKHWEVA